MNLFEDLNENDKDIANIILENSGGQSLLNEAPTTSGSTAYTPDVVVPLISYVQKEIVGKELVDVQPITYKEGKIFGLNLEDDSGNVISGIDAVGTFNSLFSELNEAKAYQEFTPIIDVTTHIVDSTYDFKIKANNSPVRDVYLTSPSGATWTLVDIASQINTNLGATAGFAEFTNTVAAAIVTGLHNLNIGIDGATPVDIVVTLTLGDSLAVVAGIIDTALTGATCSVASTGKIQIVSDTTGSSSSIVIGAALANTDVLDIIGIVETVDTGDNKIDASAEVNADTDKIRVTSTEFNIANSNILITEGDSAGSDHLVALLGVDSPVVAVSEVTVMPELVLKLTEATATVKTRKVKLSYTKELSQDLEVLKYNLEKSKLDIIGSEIASGIDYDILEAIKSHSDYHTPIEYTWSNNLTESYANPLRELHVAILTAAGNIAKATRKGLANFIVVPTLLQALISTIPGFVADPEPKLSPLAKIGKLGYLDVYVNTFDTTTYDMYVGKKPVAEIGAGVVFSPYKIEATDPVTDPEDFSLNQAIYSRYAVTKINGGNTFYHKVFLTGSPTNFPY